MQQVRQKKKTPPPYAGTDVFISYARKDQPVAHWLADCLAQEGLRVWWDPRILSGERFSSVIGKHLAASRCVVVVWSPTSTESDWVLGEATVGLERGCLIPVSIGLAQVPLPFNRLHTLDISGWRGDRAHPVYQSLVQAISRTLKSRRPEHSDKSGSIKRIKPNIKRFIVAVARIYDDPGQQLQTLIAEDLADFGGIYVVSIDKTISVIGQSPEDNRRAGEEKAREYLEAMGANVMIWGSVLRFGAKEVPQLYMTVSRSKDQRRGRYVTTDELRLPRVFWLDLAKVLQLVVSTYYADFWDQEGRYLGDQLVPYIARVRELLARAARAHGWNDDTRGLVRVHLADPLMLLGAQTGQVEPLEEAIDCYRVAISELPISRFSRDWARAKNGLGICLRLQGIRNGNVKCLNESVKALRSALTERRREGAPLEWAQTQNDLGNSYLALGESGLGVEAFRFAIRAYQQALSARTIEASPLDWAQTHNNLGVALWRLGERETEVASCEQAKMALQSSLEIYTRTRTPLDWAQAKNNLGLVLWTLGERTQAMEPISEAVKCYREALRERQPSKVPLLWAQTKSNLGLALKELGSISGKRHWIEQAKNVFIEALCESSLKEAPMEWARTKNNLGTAYWSLSDWDQGSQVLEQAVAAFRAALSVYSQEEPMFDSARTQHNLGNALVRLGDRTNDQTFFREAAHYIEIARQQYHRFRETHLWAQASGDLGLCMYLLGKVDFDGAQLSNAIRTFKKASNAYRKLGMNELADAFEKNSSTARVLLDRIQEKRRALRGCK